MNRFEQSIRHTFNTGRKYTRAGQIIHLEWRPNPEQPHMVHGVVEGWISFYDETRNLWGKYSIAMDSTDNIETIFLDLYDHTYRERHDITFEEALELRGFTETQRRNFQNEVEGFLPDLCMDEGGVEADLTACRDSIEDFVSDWAYNRFHNTHSDDARRGLVESTVNHFCGNQ